MITLFLKTGCPYCARVLATTNARNIPFTEKNIADEAVVEELIALGGKRQVPFIVDGDTMMYESQDIVDYLEAKFPLPEGKLKVHFASGTDVCQS